MRFGFPPTLQFRKQFWQKYRPAGSICNSLGQIPSKTNTNQTPESADHRVKYLSFWIRPIFCPSQLNTSDYYIISGYRDASNFWELAITVDGRLTYRGTNGGTQEFRWESGIGELHSTGAWVFVEILVDTNQATAAAAWTPMINGREIFQTSYAYTQNSPVFITGNAAETWTVRLASPSSTFPVESFIQDLQFCDGYQPTRSANTDICDGYSSRYDWIHGFDNYVDFPDTYTKLLLHLDGYDGGTAIYDYSLWPSGGKTVTPGGSVALKTTQKKFGHSSCYFPGGASDYLTIGDSADWFFGADPFTIDLWVYLIDHPSTRRIMGGYVDFDNQWSLQVNSNGTVGFYMLSTAYGSDSIITTEAIPTNQWVHVAVIRNWGGVANQYAVCLNGVMKRVQTYANQFVDYASPLYIGAANDGSQWRPWYGYLDEIRITKGVARWQANFTPPTKPYGQEQWEESRNYPRTALVVDRSDLGKEKSRAGYVHLPAGPIYESTSNVPPQQLAFTPNGDFGTDDFTGWQTGNYNSRVISDFGGHKVATLVPNGSSQCYISRLAGNVAGRRYCAMIMATKPTGAGSFRVRVSKNADLSSPVVDKICLTGMEGRMQYWRVWWDGDGTGNYYVGVVSQTQYTWDSIVVHGLWWYMDLFVYNMSYGQLGFSLDHRKMIIPSLVTLRDSSGNHQTFIATERELVYNKTTTFRNWFAIDPMHDMGDSAGTNRIIRRGGTYMAGGGTTDATAFQSDRPLPKRGRWMWRCTHTEGAAREFGIRRNPKDLADKGTGYTKYYHSASLNEMVCFFWDVDPATNTATLYRSSTPDGALTVIQAGIDATKDWFVYGMCALGYFDPGWRIFVAAPHYETDHWTPRAGYSTLEVSNLPLGKLWERRPDLYISHRNRTDDSGDKRCGLPWDASVEPTIVISQAMNNGPGPDYYGMVLTDNVTQNEGEFFHIDSAGASNGWQDTTNQGVKAWNAAEFNGYTIDGATTGPWLHAGAGNRLDMAIRAVPAAGCEILTWTGNQTDRWITHNLPRRPEFMIIYPHDASGVAIMYHLGVSKANLWDGDVYYWQAHQANLPTADTSGALFQNTHPDSTRIYIGDSTLVNETGTVYTAYVFTSSPLFKFWSHQGLSPITENGVFAFCNFMPGVVFVKNITTALGMDVTFKHSKTPGTTGHKRMHRRLDSNASDQAAPTWWQIWNHLGAKMAANDQQICQTGQSYIGCAFAQHGNMPFSEGLYHWNYDEFGILPYFYAPLYEQE